MIKILWLDDDIESIEYETTISLPEEFQNIQIEVFQRIAEFIDYLSENRKDIKNAIFIIDLMLIGESKYISFDGTEKIIKNELVAGIEFYQNSLQEFDNSIIFYTSRSSDEKIFEHIFDNKQKLKSPIYFIEKDKKDTEFTEQLKTLINKINRG